MTALSFVWVHPYSQISGCDNTNQKLLLAGAKGSKTWEFTPPVEEAHVCMCTNTCPVLPRGITTEMYLMVSVDNNTLHCA